MYTANFLALLRIVVTLSGWQVLPQERPGAARQSSQAVDGCAESLHRALPRAVAGCGQGDIQRPDYQKSIFVCSSTIRYLKSYICTMYIYFRTLTSTFLF